MHTNMHAYTHTYIHTYTHVYIHTDIHTDINIIMTVKCLKDNFCVKIVANKIISPILV